MVAVQDQAITKNYFNNKILKKDSDRKCQLCKHEETKLPEEWSIYYFMHVSYFI